MLKGAKGYSLHADSRSADKEAAEMAGCGLHNIKISFIYCGSDYDAADPDGGRGCDHARGAHDRPRLLLGADIALRFCRHLGPGRAVDAAGGDTVPEK